MSKILCAAALTLGVALAGVPASAETLVVQRPILRGIPPVHHRPIVRGVVIRHPKPFPGVVVRPGVPVRPGVIVRGIPVQRY